MVPNIIPLPNHCPNGMLGGRDFIVKLQFVEVEIWYFYVLMLRNGILMRFFGTSAILWVMLSMSCQEDLEELDRHALRRGTLSKPRWKRAAFVMFISTLVCLGFKADHLRCGSKWKT